MRSFNGADAMPLPVVDPRTSHGRGMVSAAVKDSCRVLPDPLK